MLVASKNLFVEKGSNFTLTPKNLRILAPAADSIDYSHLEYRLVEKLNFWRLYDRRSNQFISHTFSHSQLQNGDIIVIWDDTHNQINDQINPILLRVCTNSLKQAKCSPATQLLFNLKIENKMELIRNEGIFMNKGSKYAKITSKSLKTMDADTPANRLKYLVWQPVGGHLTWSHTLNNTAEPIQSFTQFDLDEGLLYFVRNETEAGFSFMVSDSLHQTRPEWFSIEPIKARKIMVLENNRKLNVSPGVASLITSEFLRAKITNASFFDIVKLIFKVSDEFIHYKLTQMPMYGRLLLENVHKPINQFTQNDINSNRLFYQSQNADLGSWSQRDSFSFVIELLEEDQQEQKNQTKNKKKPKKDDEFRFKILISYSNLNKDKLQDYLSINKLFVGNEGSVAINQTHLNMTKLSNYCDDELIVEIYQPPKYGVLLRVRDQMTPMLLTSSYNDLSGLSGKVSNATITLPKPEKNVEEEEEDELDNERLFKTSFTAEDLHSGRELIYVHLGNEEFQDDEIIFNVFPLREKQKLSSRLKIPIKISIMGSPDYEAEQINKFQKYINVVSGGNTILNSTDFQASHKSKSSSQIFYKLIQPATNGIKIMLNSAKENTQKHNSNALNSGRKSTKMPVVEFTQAQINLGMISLEHTPMSTDDKFDVLTFQVGSKESRVLLVSIEPLALHLYNHSIIVYEQPKTFVVLNRTHLGAYSNGERSKIYYNITKPPQNGSFYWVAGEKEAKWFTQKNIDNGDILYVQLNLNAFQGSSPRFLVIAPPIYGRLFLHPNPNESIAFFTHSDIQNGRLFYHAFDSPFENPVSNTEKICLELRADSVPSARFNWIIKVVADPVLKHGNKINFTGENTDLKNFVTESTESELDYRFPLITLTFVVIVILFVLFCRRDKPEVEKKIKKSNDESSTLDGISSPLMHSRHLPDLEDIARAQSNGQFANNNLDELNAKNQLSISKSKQITNAYLRL